MPNTRSAKKRLRQSLGRRDQNRSDKKSIRTQCRKVLEAVKAGNLEQAQSEFRLTAKKVDQAAAKRVIHRNAAARTKSRLSARVKSLKQGAAAGGR
jgi:small subunit ribosomal protein S20